MVFAETQSPSQEILNTIGTRLSRTANVIFALIMHDIKSRFFGSGLGQIVMVIWPFAHVGVLLAIYVFGHRTNPYGSSIIQYIGISVFPFIIFNYCGRFISMGPQNKSFLQYPIIKPMDLIVARTILETISMTIVGILLIITIAVSGADPMPASPIDAAECLAATLFFAIGFGFFNAPFSFIIPMWHLVVALMLIIMWVASGVAFVVADLPAQIREPLSYNPLLHCVEWMRISYYPDYPTSVIDKSYVLFVSMTMLSTGLILMRLLRRFF